MATKAELEVELAKLRSELKELQARSGINDTAKDDPAEQGAESSPQKDGDTETLDQDGDGIIKSMKEGHFEDVLHQLTEELGDLPARKPLLTALGALAIGYMIGRSGHRG